ncbi:MAG: mandelate racemase/muconate lactonizing enzyme family protein [Planctomycetota bacterium]|jgi:L-alanine-DL-glutamate epimerase-like enolase superfamily enzyme
MESRTNRVSIVSDNSKELGRRQFLQAAAAAPMGLITALAYAERSGARIARVELFAVRYPTKGYFKFFTGPRGAYGRGAIIVRITTDGGAVGWGQSIPSPLWSYETLETAMIAMRDYLAPVLVGRDPSDIKGAHQAMDRALAPGFSTAMPIARSGLDMAMHDLAGKLKDQSLSQMWKLSRGGSLKLSWTVNARTLDEAEKVIEAGRERGYSNFNIKVAPDPKFDIDLARLVRRRAPEGFLWADANGGYDRATALEVAPKLADAGVDVLEAPLRPNRLSGYQALTRQGALPILMDEGVVSEVELSEFIRLKMLDGLAMKPSRCGGLLTAKRQIEMILDAGLMWLGSGLTDPDISMAAALGLYGAFGQEKPLALNGPQFLTADVLAKPLAVSDGSAVVSDGPGLGVQVDEAKVARLMKETTNSTRIEI